MQIVINFTISKEPSSCPATGWPAFNRLNRQLSPTWDTQDGEDLRNYLNQKWSIFARFGDPIPFGESVSFVCEKGMAFEEDYHQTSFEVTCQVSRII